MLANNPFLTVLVPLSTSLGRYITFCWPYQFYSPFPSSQIPHPLPPPAYEPVEAVWVNYTVEENGTTSEMSSGPLPPSTESFVIENATLGATYTITVSALNQLGRNGSTISVTVDSTCKQLHGTLPRPDRVIVYNISYTQQKEDLHSETRLHHTY